MKFECGDLDRALGAPELMPEAKEHLKTCAKCRSELRLWNNISGEARGMHEEWESPKLWERIEAAIEQEPKPKKRVPNGWSARRWTLLAVAASCILTAGLFVYQRETVQTPSVQPQKTEAPIPNAAAGNAANADFLTDQALKEVEQREQAYRDSIEKLSRLAQSKLAKTPPALAVNYREKLLLIDSAIADTRATLEHNQFNVRLQADLAGLYREKQLTLQELVTRDQKN